MTQRQTRFGWALFDWAQQPYFSLVGSFIFRPYFVAAVAVTPAIGQVQIGLTGAIAGLVVAIAGPLLGVAMDRGNLKAWLAWTSLPLILACLALWWATPAGSAPIILILVALTVAAIFAELSTAVNNAMLPAIAAPGGMGRLSGGGVALGCLGGVVATAIYLVLFINPAQPLLGLSQAAHEPERFVGPFSAIWYVLFLLPLFLLYPRDTRVARPARPLGELVTLIRALPGNRPMLWFLAGRMLTTDATAAVQIFGGIIAATTFGLQPAEIGLVGLLVLGAAGIGSLLGGLVDDRVSAKMSVQVTCVAFAIALLGIGSVGPDHIFFVIPVTPVAPGVTFLAGPAGQIFAACWVLLGLATGPLTGSMRTWMAELAPRGEEGRWFGLYAVAGRATAFAAPLMVTLGTLLTGNVAAAVPVIFIFLLAGMLAFWRVPATVRA